MATLLLIRHGQASFMKDNYDQLSEKGFEQSRSLGKYLVEKDYQFDILFTGRLRRHLETMQTAIESYPKDKIANLKIVEDDDFNEHQATRLYEHYKDEFVNRDKALHDLLEEKGNEHPEVRQGMILLFFKIIQLWCKGELIADGVEPYKEFSERVRGAYARLLEAMSKNKSGVAFTSGGTIGMMMSILLGLRDEQMVELNWQVRNTSMTEFYYRQGKFFLRSFNEIPHLESHLITYV